MIVVSNTSPLTNLAAIGHFELIVFDGRKAAEPLPARCAMEEVEWEGRKIAVVRL